MKYAYLLLIAVLALASCTSDEIVTEDPKPEIVPQEITGYRFSLNVGEPTTRVTYHDNIGAKDSPYNPNSDGSNKLTMSWRDGDELVAIRWSGDFDEYVVLKAKVPEGQDLHVISFNANDVSHFKTPLQDGEPFVLVHGDFVLDASDKNDPKLDFPTSQVTKAGYASHIHHGGKVEGSDITFRNQDGTLENLRKHEYMVANCHATVGDKDGSGIVTVGFQSEEDTNYVMMHIAHTLLRLTLFLPDEDFNKGGEEDIISVSLKDVEEMNKIFHRYFRMHPNKPNETYYYETSYNDKADKEENSYIRINIEDEATGKKGVGLSHENVYGSDTFNPKKPVCVKSSLNDTDGHYLTLYFSLPSRHMGLDGQSVSELKVTAFTRNSAHTTTKTYRLPDDAMLPGQVVPLNVSFNKDNSAPIKAITDPELGISFTPGFVYANKVDGKWVYGVYKNQGEYAGMSHQTLDFGEYFTFGSVDPTQAAHRIGSTKYSPVVPKTFTDVASLVEENGKSDIYHMLTKAEADRVMARFNEEVKKSGVFLGYYYYDDKNGNTKHKAPGSQNPTILNAAAAGGKKTVDELKDMSASVGIYVGCSEQPKFEEQDDYFFLPNAKQMSDKTEGTTFPAVQTCTDDDGNAVYYFLPTDYTDLDATGDNDKLTKKFSTQFKFSTWLRTVETGPKPGYRMQVWTNDKGTAINTGSTNVSLFEGTIARPIRAVIY